VRRATRPPLRLARQVRNATRRPCRLKRQGSSAERGMYKALKMNIIAKITTENGGLAVAGCGCEG